MANHQQHTTFSTASGLIFGTLAWYPGGFPAVTCLLAGGLCGMGGMLPDIDIKTSRSFHDCMSIAACVASMLVILKVGTTEGITGEMLAIIGTMVFIAIKFGVGGLIQTFTKHRGLIHSIPFCLMCGEIVFLIAPGDAISRVLKAAGLSLGFFSHLLLDEIYSVDVVQGKLNTKKSFGTAIKFGMTKHVNLTVVLYLLLCFATFIAVKSPDMIGEAFDRALDRIAGLTIQGAQHFEHLSQTAQHSLRENTSIGRVTILTSQTDEVAQATDMQLDQAEEDQDESRERRYDMQSLAQITASVSAPKASTTATLTSTQPARQTTDLRAATSPGFIPVVSAVPPSPAYPPLLLSELEQSRSGGRPPALLTELEQSRASGATGYHNTTPLPSAMPIQ